MATHQNVLGLTLDLKHTYSTHIRSISVHAHNPLHIIKGLTAPGWGKQKKTHMTTYNAVMRPALEYASSIWSPLASSSSITKLQVNSSHHWELPHDAHKTQTTTYVWRNTHPSHTQALTVQRLTIQTKNTTTITSLRQTYNMLQHSKVQNTNIFKKAVTQQTFPQTPTQSLQQT